MGSESDAPAGEDVAGSPTGHAESSDDARIRPSPTARFSADRADELWRTVLRRNEILDETQTLRIGVPDHHHSPRTPALSDSEIREDPLALLTFPPGTPSDPDAPASPASPVSITAPALSKDEGAHVSGSTTVAAAGSGVVALRSGAADCGEGRSTTRIAMIPELSDPDLRPAVLTETVFIPPPVPKASPENPEDGVAARSSEENTRAFIKPAMPAGESAQASRDDPKREGNPVGEADTGAFTHPAASKEKSPDPKHEADTHPEIRKTFRFGNRSSRTKSGARAPVYPPAPSATRDDPAALPPELPQIPSKRQTKNPSGRTVARVDDSVVVGRALLRPGTLGFDLGRLAKNPDKVRPWEWEELYSRLQRVPDADSAGGGDFEIQESLGVGGMGAVFRARQTCLDRQIVLKTIRPDEADHEEIRAKFAAEAMVTGVLDHPNIVAIYEFGQAQDGSLYYAMQEVRGHPWSRSMKLRSEAENLAILGGVCNAIAFAHDKGFLHRDIKPENIMIGDYGEVLVMDWGLAVSLDRETGRPRALTTETAVAGTPAFMAPEMARGDVDRIGPGSDIYLLGGILHEILTGRHPHSGGGAGIIACLLAAANNDLTPCSRNDELAMVARKALATHPMDRYQSVKEFQQAFGECREHAESLRLTHAADDDLTRAVSSGDYNDFTRARFGYLSALKLWEQNPKAKVGLSKALREHARQALEHRDYDLALSLLAAETDAESNELRRRAGQARDARDAREFRSVWLLRSALFVGMIFLAVTVTSLVFTLSAHRQTERALQDTSEARRRENNANAKALASIREMQIQTERARAAEAERARAAERARREAERAARAEAERARAAEQAAARLKLSVRAERENPVPETEGRSWVASAFQDEAGARRRQEEAARRLGVEPVWAVVSGDFSARFAVIPAGEISGGAHPIHFAAPFALQAAPFTRAQWRALMGEEDPETLSDAAEYPDPSNEMEMMVFAFAADARAWRTRPLTPETADLPATGISAHEIQTRLLPRLVPLAPAGWRFALPTLAHWNYLVAVRAVLEAGSPREQRSAQVWGLSRPEQHFQELMREASAGEGGERWFLRGGDGIFTEGRQDSVPEGSVSAKSQFEAIGFRLLLLPPDTDQEGASPASASMSATD